MRTRRFSGLLVLSGYVLGACATSEEPHVEYSSEVNAPGGSPNLPEGGSSSGQASMPSTPASSAGVAGTPSVGGSSGGTPSLPSAGKNGGLGGTASAGTGSGGSSAGSTAGGAPTSAGAAGKGSGGGGSSSAGAAGSFGYGGATAGSSAGGSPSGGAAAGGSTGQGGAPTGGTGGSSSNACNAQTLGLVRATHSTLVNTKSDTCVELVLNSSWSSVQPALQTAPGTSGYPIPFSYSLCNGMSGTGTLKADYQRYDFFTSSIPNPKCNLYVQFEGSGTPLKFDYYD